MKKTNYPSRIKKNMQGTTNEVRTNLLVTFFYGLLQMDTPVLTNKTCISISAALPSKLHEH